MQEIIEFPCLKVDSTTYEIEAVFHKYVNPKVNKILTPFCTDLTGIMQDMVSGEPEFPAVLQEFCNWFNIQASAYSENETIFVTCGNWDLMTMLPNQCHMLNINIPPHMRRWINLKTSFIEATGFYGKGLKSMLKYLGLPSAGKLHSGIDDCKNIVQIMEALHISGYIFRETNRIN